MPAASPARRRPLRAIAALLLALALVAGWGGTAAAQVTGLPGLGGLTWGGGGSAPAPAEAPPAAEPVERGGASGSMAGSAAERARDFRAHVRELAAEVPGGFAAMRAALAAQSPTGAPGYFAGVALVTGVLILIGRAVGQMAAFGLFRPLMIRTQRMFADPQGIADKLPVLALRMALTAAFIVVVAAVAAVLGLWLVEDHGPTQATAALILFYYFLYLLVDTAWRMILCPYLPDYRIPAIGDAEARTLYFWLSGLTLLAVVGKAYAEWLGALGLDPKLVAVNSIGFALTGLAVSVALVWVNREAVSGMILGGRTPEAASWPQRLGARIWAPAVTAYLIVAGLEECVRAMMGGSGGVSLLSGLFATLLLGLTVYAVGIYVAERLFAPRPGRVRPGDGAETEAPPAAGDPEADGDEEGGGGPAAAAAAPIPSRSGMRTYRDLAGRVASLLALGVAGYVLIRIWAGPAAFAETAPLGILEDLVDILLIGYVGYHAARIWLDRRIADEGVDEVAAKPGDEGGGASASSRLGTLLPLLRSAVLVVIAASAGVLAAMELGINVAPLFAGAGIVGLAIGFGAQTLVRDILSGVFFLLDDAFRKGEYIDIGGVKGTVEKISIRSFQLRHHLGALQTVPFGEIKHLTNFSRDWVMMKLPLRLTYDTDPDQVRKLIKKLGEKLLQHPTEGPKFMQPLKSQGVFQMEDSAMIIRVKYMTRPGDQWTTRKLVYQEIRDLFAKEGIKFAHREVTVRIPDLEKDGHLNEAEARAVGAAARRAVEELDAPPTPAAALVEGR